MPIFSKFHTVDEAFANLTATMRTYLAKADIEDMRRACIERMKYKLPPSTLDKVKSSKNITSLFNVLAESDYWSWIDVRLLSVMVAASRIEETVRILESYKLSIFSKKLVEVLPKMQPKRMKKYFTALTTKLKREANKMTVTDLLEWQSTLETVIIDIGKGTCVISHVKPKACIEVHWYIPTRFVDSVYKSASINRCRFIEIHLLWLQIAHYPVVYNPMTSLSVPLPTPLPVYKSGKHST